MNPPDIETHIDSIVARYPQKTSALVPILQVIQEAEGYVSTEAQERVAARLQIPPAWVAGVVSFYTMIYDRPRGRYHLQICRTLSCALRGADALTERIGQRLGIGPGETTGDGAFTLTPVECLGSCGTAPVIQINDDYYEELSVESLDRLLDRLNGTA